MQSKVGVLGMMSLTAVFTVAQQARSTQGKTAEQVYENIKVLRGTPADSFNQMMHLMSAQLGVDCEYCHLQKDRVSDELALKPFRLMRRPGVC